MDMASSGALCLPLELLWKHQPVFYLQPQSQVCSPLRDMCAYCMCDDSGISAHRFFLKKEECICGCGCCVHGSLCTVYMSEVPLWPLCKFTGVFYGFTLNVRTFFHNPNFQLILLILFYNSIHWGDVLNISSCTKISMTATRKQEEKPCNTYCLVGLFVDVTIFILYNSLFIHSLIQTQSGHTAWETTNP